MKTLRLLGSVYDLDMNAEMNDRGEAEFHNKKIRVNKGLPKELKMATLLHELIEVINAEFELKLEHRTISQLELGLKIIFCDNPELRNIIFEKGGK